MLLDTLVVTFMDEWENNDTSFGYYGVMGRDFLEYLAGRRKNQEIYYAQGSSRELPSPDDFGAQANEDYKLAVQAVEYEFNDHHYRPISCGGFIWGFVPDVAAMDRIPASRHYIPKVCLTALFIYIKYRSGYGMNS